MKMSRAEVIATLKQMINLSDLMYGLLDMVRESLEGDMQDDDRIHYFLREIMDGSSSDIDEIVRWLEKHRYLAPAKSSDLEINPVQIKAIRATSIIVSQKVEGQELCAYTGCDFEHPEAGIMIYTKDGDPIDLVYTKGDEENKDRLMTYIYADPTTEDWTDQFSISFDDFVI